MRVLIMAAAACIVTVTIPLAGASPRKMIKKAPASPGIAQSDQERLEGFYLEMPVAFCLPKGIQEVLKALVQGKTELEDRYSKLYMDKKRLGNWLLVQVEAIRDEKCSKVRQETIAIENDMAKWKEKYAVVDIAGVRQKLVANQTIVNTRSYPPGYTPQQVTDMHIEIAQMMATISFFKAREEAQKDVERLNEVVEFVRNWLK